MEEKNKEIPGNEEKQGKYMVYSINRPTHKTEYIIACGNERNVKRISAVCIGLVLSPRHTIYQVCKEHFEPPAIAFNLQTIGVVCPLFL